MMGEKAIATAADFLSNGGIVAIPTETVYGLAADATNLKAITRVFEAKNRPFFDPLICHFYSLERIQDLVPNLTEDQAYLLQALSPGPLTLLVPRPSAIPDLVTSGSSLMAVRIPNHTITLELLRRLPFPLAAPSANPFGYLSPTRASHVKAQLADRVDFVLDGGPCEVGVESTVVELTPTEGFILRPGGTTVEQLQQTLPHLAWKMAVAEGNGPKSPGMLESHYAPSKPIFLVDNPEQQPDTDIQSALFIGLDVNSSLPYSNQYLLAQSGDLGEAAADFFHALHEADADSSTSIVVQNLPDNGLGRAMNDRLKRAAAKRG